MKTVSLFLLYKSEIDQLVDQPISHTKANKMAEHDLTQKITPYLDTHLALQLLSFLRSDNVNVGK
jgi:hypothetical protein